MTNLPERLVRPWRLPLLARLPACLLACLLALAACGPGTGGTGTGPEQGSFGSLRFSGASIGPISATAAGTAADGPTPPVSPGCGAAPCLGADLRLEALRVELLAPCARFVRNEAWEVDAAGLALLPGSFESTSGAGTATVPATLRLQFSASPAASLQVTATVSAGTGSSAINSAGNGGILLGPLVLQRNEAVSAALPGCSVR